MRRLPSGVRRSSAAERKLVPKLAGDRLVLLIEPFAVIGIFADPDFVTDSEPDFAEPVGIGERLPRGADDVAYLAAR